jgi:hypothetical protein
MYPIQLSSFPPCSVFAASVATDITSSIMHG